MTTLQLGLLQPTQTIQLSSCRLGDLSEGSWFYVRLHTGQLKAYRVQKRMTKPRDPEQLVFVEVIS